MVHVTALLLIIMKWGTKRNGNEYFEQNSNGINGLDYPT